MRSNKTRVLPLRNTNCPFPSKHVANNKIPRLDPEDAFIAEVDAIYRRLDEQPTTERTDSDLRVSLLRVNLHHAPLQLHKVTERHPIDLHSVNPAICSWRRS